MKVKNESEKVIVFGFSDNPERYSYKAFHLLKDFGHQAIAFNPREQNISELLGECDTLTLYVNAAISDKFAEPLLSLKCKRVIFNPGTENPALEEKFKDRGVEVIRGCTLVMLRTDQF